MNSISYFKLEKTIVQKITPLFYLCIKDEIIQTAENNEISVGLYRHHYVIIYISLTQTLPIPFLRQNWFYGEIVEHIHLNYAQLNDNDQS